MIRFCLFFVALAAHAQVSFGVLRNPFLQFSTPIQSILFNSICILLQSTKNSSKSGNILPSTVYLKVSSERSRQFLKGLILPPGIEPMVVSSIGGRVTDSAIRLILRSGQVDEKYSAVSHYYIIELKNAITIHKYR